MFNPLKKLGAFDKITNSWLNDLLAWIFRRTNIIPGHGIDARLGTAGWTISTTLQKDDTGGTPKVLAHVMGTQDTDSWSAESDNTPVTVTQISDIFWSATVHKIQCRTREYKYDKLGNLISISAESEPVDLIAATSCP